jgi:hypothetical protein
MIDRLQTNLNYLLFDKGPISVNILDEILFIALVKRRAAGHHLKNKSCHLTVLEIHNKTDDLCSTLAS